MGSQWGRDRYHRRAKSEGYRSRAAYKLLDIQRRFQLIRPDDNVVDLGAAPGSWLQVLREITEGTVIGVDLNPIASVEDTLTITGDFTRQAVQDSICSHAGEVGVVVCDAAPKLSGHKSYDQARSIGLAEDALEFCCTILKPGGNFVVKAFQGEQFDDFLAEVRERFRSVRVYRTKATRKGSTEAYVIAKNFRGPRDAA
ncbi:MAG TPA: RlmE family RNA methyltransferase [Methanoculleus sp.]|nr:RlmE family RNA methyltransferase [Methanoculleus sp.]